MKLYFSLMMTLLILLCFGCAQTVVKYQCADGSFVDSASLCSTKLDTNTDCDACTPKIEYKEKEVLNTIIKYQCYDGLLKDNVEDCLNTILGSDTNNSFWDVYCNEVSTSLQKNEIINKNMNKYLIWSGQVYTINGDNGEYRLFVKHCPSTSSYDARVYMKSNQKDILLKYNEKDTITYKARITKYDEGLLGDVIEADNGEVILASN